MTNPNDNAAPRTFVWHDALGIRHEEPQDEYIARARERAAATPLTVTDQEFRDVTDRAHRFALTPRIAALRPGDEIEITHAGRRTWVRVTDCWEVARGRFVRGRTTLGMVATTHAHWITDVRPETCDAVRESWIARHGQ